jgi:tetratricopeptide (TPR) repeat protein
MKGGRWMLLAMLMSGNGWAQNHLSEAVRSNEEAVRLANEGRTAEAEKLYLAALGAGYDDDLARAKIANNLAALYRQQDRFRDAESMFQSALQWRQKNLPAASDELAYSFNNLAEIYRVEGRNGEARRLMETAMHSLQRFHPDAPGLPVIISNLAIVLCSFKEYNDAEELLRSALILYDQQSPTPNREYGVTLNNLGQVLESKNDLDGAASLYQQAIGIFERLGAPARIDLAGALANSGALDERLDRIEDARQAEERALELLHPAGDAVLRAQILRNLGNIVVHAGNPIESLPYFEQSLLIQERALGEVHPATASLLLDYSFATLRAGKKSLSRKLRKRATDLLARLSSESMDQLTVSVRDLRAGK